jgi:hypothetical protein
MFHIGQKVVCIAGFKRHGFGLETFPVKDGVYTIRDLCRCGDTLGLRLEEIINQPMPYAEGRLEAVFGAQFFRPLIERKTDISCFTRILDKVNKRETVKCP